MSDLDAIRARDAAERQWRPTYYPQGTRFDYRVDSLGQKWTVRTDPDGTVHFNCEGRVIIEANAL